MTPEQFIAASIVIWCATVLFGVTVVVVSDMLAQRPQRPDED